MLSQISNLKAPFDVLWEVHPGIAVKIKESAAALAKAGHKLHFFQTNNEISLELGAVDLLHLAAEYRELLDDVRQLPGFETFLKPKTLEELAPAASDGPVVCINLCGRRTDALILCQSASTGPIIEHIPLPKMSPYWARKLCMELSIQEHHHKLRRFFNFGVERNRNFLDFQKSLWDFLVGPILDRCHSMNEVCTINLWLY